MFRMSAFSVDTGRQTTPPLVDGVVHTRLVQFAQHGKVRTYIGLCDKFYYSRMYNVFTIKMI